MESYCSNIICFNEYDSTSTNLAFVVREDTDTEQIIKKIRKHLDVSSGSLFMFFEVFGQYAVFQEENFGQYFKNKFRYECKFNNEWLFIVF